MSEKIVGKSSGIPIRVGHPQMDLEGHVELFEAFRQFEAGRYGPARPEAESFQDKLRPRPMAALGAQPFKHIRVKDLLKLLRRWSSQLNRLAQKRGQIPRN